MISGLPRPEASLYALSLGFAQRCRPEAGVPGRVRHRVHLETGGPSRQRPQGNTGSRRARREAPRVPA